MSGPTSKAALKVIDKAIRAVERKLPFKSEKARNAMLEYAAGDMAESYLIGAEEAQGEFLARLQTIRRALLPPKPSPPSTEPNEAQLEIERNYGIKL